MGPYWYTVTQAADELGLSEAELSAAIERGELLTFRRGDAPVIVAAELERFRDPVGYRQRLRAEHDARLRLAIGAETMKAQRELRAEILALLPPGWSLGEEADDTLRGLTSVSGAGWRAQAVGPDDDYIATSAMLRSEALINLRDALRRRWLERKLTTVPGWHTDGDSGPLSAGTWFDGPDGRRYLVEVDSAADAERTLFLMRADQGDFDAYDVAWIVPADLIGDAAAVSTALLSLPDGGLGEPLPQVRTNLKRLDQSGAIWVGDGDFRPGQPVLLTDGETALRARMVRDTTHDTWVARPLGAARKVA